MVQQPEVMALLLTKQHRSQRRFSSWTSTKLAQQLQVRQFGFGQSNPTYCLTISVNDVDEESLMSLVLRKKPAKVAHPSAHALHREFRVLRSLQEHSASHEKLKRVPVPVVHVYCKDVSVLGAEFYLMEYVQGRIFTDPSLPGMTSKERQAAFDHVITVLANLHAVDCEQVGLSNYGPKGAYVQRQLQRLLAVSPLNQPPTKPADTSEVAPFLVVTGGRATLEAQHNPNSPTQKGGGEGGGTQKSTPFDRPQNPLPLLLVSISTCP
jgi:hypothetical protein